MTDVDMGRLIVSLPAETVQEITDLAAQSGLKRGQFASVALVIGSRALARQIAAGVSPVPAAVSEVRAAGIRKSRAGRPKKSV